MPEEQNSSEGLQTFYHSSPSETKQERLQTDEDIQISDTLKHSEKGYKVSDGEENKLNDRDLLTAAENTSRRMKRSINRVCSIYSYKGYSKGIELRHISDITSYAEHL